MLASAVSLVRIFMLGKIEPPMILQRNEIVQNKP